MKRNLYAIASLLPLLAVYSYFAYDLNFIQDDAYITYRYVANFLNSDGLVYNIGERIEGFTNFGWTIFLCLLGGLKIDYIFYSQLAGFMCGGAFIVVVFLIARAIVSKHQFLFAWLAAALTAANISLAYWSPAGLETAAFALLCMLSLLFFLNKNYLLIAVFSLLVWVRPDGAVMVACLIFAEAIISRRIPRFSLTCALVALIVSIPFVIFKLVYYGSILPNPFYAKTGLNLEILTSGLEYLFRFFSHYGFYGIPFLLTACFYKRFSNELKTILIVTSVFTIYIVLVGGDVLKAHRFFLPLFGLFAIVNLAGFYFAASRLKDRYRAIVLTGAAVIGITLTVILPRSFVTGYNKLEILFVNKMARHANLIKSSDSSDFTVATSTIGRFGYELMGHDIIDMVGLTDSTIARHSEEPIPGMQTTWKEQSLNSSYLLLAAPDYFVFSTGMKPSAPAERALFLYPAFMDSYRPIGWMTNLNRLVTLYAFKRMMPVQEPFEATYPVEYIQHYKEGLDNCAARKLPEAIRNFTMALTVSPKPYYPHLLYQKAFTHLQLGDFDLSVSLLNSLLKQDSLTFEAHRDLIYFSLLNNENEKAAIHAGWVKRLVPWDYDRIMAQVNAQLRKSRR